MFLHDFLLDLIFKKYKKYLRFLESSKIDFMLNFKLGRYPYTSRNWKNVKLEVTKSEI